MISDASYSASLAHAIDRAKAASNAKGRDARSTSVSFANRLVGNNLKGRFVPRRTRAVPEEDEHSAAASKGNAPRSLISRGQSWVGLLLLTAALVLVGLGTWWLPTWLSRPEETISIPHADYHPVLYHHLDESVPIKLKPSTQVFHVTKEFGPATMGGLGTMLTALAINQAASPFLNVSIIMPFYSYLRDEFPGEIQAVTDLSVPMLNSKENGLSRVLCRVSVLKWKYAAVPDFLNPNSPKKPQTKIMNIFLVGAGKSPPFTSAFHAKDAGDIYSAYKPLKQEWKDLWFAKATSEFLSFMSTRIELSVFQLDDEKGYETGFSRGVDLVHLHGATNAMVAHFMHGLEETKALGDRPPALVYTLHDTVDEVEYTNTLTNVVHFVDPTLTKSAGSIAPAKLHSYLVADTLVFTSALGIDHAEQVTFVSQSIAAAIVEGRFKFPLQDLILPSLGRKAGRGDFVGVSNGLDFADEQRNPFISRTLDSYGLTFPRVGPNVMDLTSFWSREPSLALGGGSQLAQMSFARSKREAKALLVEKLPHLFSERDLDRPWFLFIGRFQYNKGCQFFDTVVDLISNTKDTSADARLIAMGAHNNYPAKRLRSLARRHPQHFTLLDVAEEQLYWGPVLRMASDFAFVPSFSEAFGLVAAEGLLFGMEVVSTGVGGLLEFLTPMGSGIVSTVADKGNAFLFSIDDPVPAEMAATQNAGTEFAINSGGSGRTRIPDSELRGAFLRCQDAIRAAVVDWKAKRFGATRKSWVEEDTQIRRLVADALALKWNRKGGPVEEYIRVYDRALRMKRQALKSMHGKVQPAAIVEEVIDVPVEVSTPAIEHGGHDRVSGQQGLEHVAALADSVEPNIPIYKVWWSRGGSGGGAGKGKKPK